MNRAVLTCLLVGLAGCEQLLGLDLDTYDSEGTTTSSATDGGAGGGKSAGGMGGATTTGNSTGGTPCTTVDDCPPASAPCVSTTCEDAQCGEAPTRAGTPAAVQQPGDCKVVQCDGAGETIDVVDDSDLPVDDNECTDDVCTDGAPSNPFLEAGTTCAAGGKSKCDGGGNCVECIIAADCPGEDTECQTRTCNAGQCDVKNAMQGTAVASQTEGDCQVNQCDGDGGVETVADESDPVVGSDPCTIHSCDGAMPKTDPAPINTACGANGSLVCDGDGQCVGCTAADQCDAPANPCLDVVCGPNGACGTVDKDDGTACDDGNACSQTDLCQAGMCTGSSPVACTALDPCHQVGVCNPVTGLCSNPIKTCAALDQCHDVGVCNPVTGVCSNPNKANGATCNDGNGCTQTDTCQAGTCTGGNPVTCTALDECHDAGVCNPVTGVCSNPNKADNTPCNDSNGCTQTDTCQAGTCTGANPVVCTALDQCHVAGVCNPATGACSNPAKANNTPCDDGNGCTQADKCQAGVCMSGGPVTCTALDQCHDVGTCDPGTGACSNPNKADNTSCNDNNGCTQTDTCQAGTCTGRNPVFCTALDECHVAGPCNPGTGVCSNPNAADGTSCTADGDPGACSGGVCIAESCADGIQNGDETDVDCGGSCPAKCDFGDSCLINADCSGNVCDNGVCI